jgi:hypothetical protein
MRKTAGTLEFEFLDADDFDAVDLGQSFDDLFAREQDHLG